MIFYTDGSAHPNPGPGGFGVVVVDETTDTVVETYSKAQDRTTNNEQEMKAILWATLYAIQHGITQHIKIYSDSAYAINTFSSWMYGWAKNGWRKKDKKEPENIEIVKAFYDLMKTYSVDFCKVEGHSGIKYNEMADKLATGAQ